MIRLDTNLRRVLAALGIALALQACGTVFIEGYSSTSSVRSILVLASLLGVASIGQTLVIVLGGIDLSIPFVIGFANVAAAQLYGFGMPFFLVCLLVLLVSAMFGAISGALSSSLKVHPLIITLGIGTAVQGAVLLWTGGLPSGSAPDALGTFVSIGGHAWIIPVPGLVLAFATLAILVTLVLTHTSFGRRLYALGSNPTAACFALISQFAMSVVTYALSACFAALAGILLLGFTGSAYGDVGQPYFFQTIAAVVIGGTVLVGGRGGLPGTVAGSLVLTEVNTLLIGIGLTPSMVESAVGLVIVVLMSIYGREPHIRTTI